jgi:hypothetical protein
VPKLVAFCLAGVLISLLLVGAVSGTFVRHVIQVIPIALALMIAWHDWRLAAFCALPIFAVWAFLMLMIWLYLAGVQTFFSGTFSTTEVLLTVVIGGLSIVGFVAAASSSRVKPVRALAAIAVFGVMQFAALVVSFLPSFVNR